MTAKKDAIPWYRKYVGMAEACDSKSIFMSLVSAQQKPK